MRVLFVAPAAYPLGGVQVWLDYVLPGLAHRGWEPILGLVSGRWHDVERYVMVHPDHKCVAISNMTGSREGRIRALIQAIRRTKPALLVVVNIYDCYAAIERIRVAGEIAPHVVMADHSIEPDFLCDASAWNHVLDGFVGTNRLTVQLAQDYACVDIQRTHYAPYGVSLSQGTGQSGVTSGVAIRIAYSGRVEEDQKRAQDIPVILAKLEGMGVPFAFRLAGDGPYMNTLRQQLSPQVARGTVEFLGVLDSAGLDEQLYRWANVLLVTSLWETGPLVIWEAMARGVCVVSSRYVGSGLEGALRHNENCLLFSPGDADAAAAQLRRVTDTSLRCSLAEKGRALVADRYSRERSIARWDDCLRRVTEQPCLSSDRRLTRCSPSGRMDRWFGVERGESLRRLLRIAHHHDAPGGEWPHTGSVVPKQDEDEFWAMARRADVA